MLIFTQSISRIFCSLSLHSEHNRNLSANTRHNSASRSRVGNIQIKTTALIIRNNRNIFASLREKWKSLASEFLRLFHCINDAMAEWKVSGSESEGDGAKESTLDFGGFQIPPPRIVKLLQSVERHKTLKLDCLNDTRRKERRRAKRRRRNKVHSPGTVRSLEEVSETASEVRSTTSTTDCRDARR